MNAHPGGDDHDEEDNQLHRSEGARVAFV